MRFLRFLIISLVLAAVPIGFALAAQDPTPLSVRAMRHHASGVDRVFEFDIANALDREVTAHGRLVLISVYGTGLPDTVLIDDVTVPPGGVSTVTVLWRNAPLVGQVRALLVMMDDSHASLVQSFAFWLVPLGSMAIFAGIAVLLALLALALMRLPRYFKDRVPSNTTIYIAEADDTVMTLAGRFEVTWQDLVRANRLKPPYTLTPGLRVFIPKHGLKRPEAPPKPEAP